MAIVTIDDPDAVSNARREELQRALEEGKILYLPRSPIEIPAPDREFLLGLRQSRASYHKNIAYRPESDRVTGFDASSPQDSRRLTGVLRRYSRAAIAYLTALFPSYSSSWTVDYASFRPLEEEGRDLSPQKKNDLMHVDAFPTRPTHGDRIFRFFTNINPVKSRRWKTGAEVFPALARRFAVSSGLLAKAARGSLASMLRSWGAAAGLPVRARSRYDEFMLRFHDYLKENAEYQTHARAEEFEFPPGSSWMVYTDMVSHAVLSGQFALEQTFLIARAAMALPDRVPIAVLEKIAGRPLA